MLDNRFSIWLICELLNDNGVTRAELGKRKVNIKLWLTWCVDVWPLLWVCDFLWRFHITQGLVICGCFRGLSCAANPAFELGQLEAQFKFSYLAILIFLKELKASDFIVAAWGRSGFNVLW